MRRTAITAILALLAAPAAAQVTTAPSTTMPPPIVTPGAPATPSQQLNQQLYRNQLQNQQRALQGQPGAAAVQQRLETQSELNRMNQGQPPR